MSGLAVDAERHVWCYERQSFMAHLEWTVVEEVVMMRRHVDGVQAAVTFLPIGDDGIEFDAPFDDDHHRLFFLVDYAARRLREEDITEQPEESIDEDDTVPLRDFLDLQQKYEMMKREVEQLKDEVKRVRQEEQNSRAAAMVEKAHSLAVALSDDIYSNVTPVDEYTAMILMTKLADFRMRVDTDTVFEIFTAWAIASAPIRCLPFIGPLEEGQDRHEMSLMPVRKHQTAKLARVQAVRQMTQKHGEAVTSRHEAVLALGEAIKAFMASAEVNPQKALRALFRKLPAATLNAVQEELAQKSATLPKKVDAISPLVWGAEMMQLAELSQSIESLIKTASSALLFAVSSASYDTGSLKVMVETILSGEDEAM
jgi:hypothetical protein